MHYDCSKTQRDCSFSDDKVINICMMCILLFPVGTNFNQPITYCSRLFGQFDFFYDIWVSRKDVKDVNSALPKEFGAQISRLICLCQHT